jgi:hypothetical protein
VGGRGWGGKENKKEKEKDEKEVDDTECGRRSRKRLKVKEKETRQGVNIGGERKGGGEGYERGGEGGKRK